MLGMSEKLPDKPKDESVSPPDGETRIFNIGNLHLHANDIDALRRLAEVDSDLAKMVVKQREDIDKREHASMRLGIICACVIVAVLLFAGMYAMVHLGVVLSLILVFVLVALAFFVRVLLTGKWPETTWIGHFVKLAVTALGGKPKSPEDE